MKHLCILAAVATVVWPVIALADGSPRTIRVTGTGETHVKPDFATVDIGTFAMAASAVQAKRACDKAMAHAIGAIRKLGVKADDIETTEYSVFPLRAKASGALTWKVVESAVVKVRSLPIVAEVIDTAVANGAPEVSNIQFGLDAAGPARMKARTLAVAAAKEKAEALAKMLAVELGEVQSVTDEGSGDTELNVNGVMTAWSSAMRLPSGVPMAISGGQRTVTAEVSVVYEIK